MEQYGRRGYHLKTFACTWIYIYIYKYPQRPFLNSIKGNDSRSRQVPPFLPPSLPPSLPLTHSSKSQFPSALDALILPYRAKRPKTVSRSCRCRRREGGREGDREAGDEWRRHMAVSAISMGRTHSVVSKKVRTIPSQRLVRPQSYHHPLSHPSSPPPSLPPSTGALPPAGTQRRGPSRPMPTGRPLPPT